MTDERVLWQEQVEAPVPGGGPLPARADVVVVGAGYAGLAAAAHLSAAGRHVVVLEKQRLGWGAHARNGGMVIPELKAGPAALRKKYGPLGDRMFAEVNEAFDWVESLVAGPDPAIPCDYERTGQLYLAHRPSRTGGLKAFASELVDAGEPARFVAGDELADEIGSDQYRAGVVLERTGGLQPARFHAGLAGRALAAGAIVLDGTPALAIEELLDGRHRVTTTAGTVDAADVLVATNAYADGLLPELARRVLPVGSYIVATEPLDPTVAEQVSPRRRMFVDTKNFLFYWRLSPDGRMVFGGRRSLRPTGLDEAERFLTESLHRVHPQLAGVPVTHRWGGYVAVTFDRLPHAGKVRGAWYVTGCNGSGVATNTWLGHRTAQAMLGQEPPAAVSELAHRPIPLHRWKRAWLPVVGTWFSVQDAR